MLIRVLFFFLKLVPLNRTKIAVFSWTYLNFLPQPPRISILTSLSFFCDVKNKLACHLSSFSFSIKITFICLSIKLTFVRWTPFHHSSNQWDWALTWLIIYTRSKFLFGSSDSSNESISSISIQNCSPTPPPSVTLASGIQGKSSRRKSIVHSSWSSFSSNNSSGTSPNLIMFRTNRSSLEQESDSGCGWTADADLFVLALLLTAVVWSPPEDFPGNLSDVLKFKLWMYSCKREVLGFLERLFLLEYCLLLVAFQWFLIEFWVLLGSFFAISDHLLPISACAWISILSSSSLHVSFCEITNFLDIMEQK